MVVGKECYQLFILHGIATDDMGNGLAQQGFAPNVFFCLVKSVQHELQYFRVEPQTTPFTYGDYGTVSVRDLGYWQDDDSYAYDSNYGCFIYTNVNKNGVVLAVQYFVSAGSLGYGWDEFEPEE